MFLFNRRKKNNNKDVIVSSSSSSSSSSGKQNGNFEPLNRFYPEELQKATNNYDPNCIFQYQDHYKWYKGSLGGRNILVKVFDNLEMFINDTKLAAQFDSHQSNVLKLLGCCVEPKVPHAVYEFPKNGILFDHIYRVHTSSQLDLNLKIRLRIAKEIADSISYLHTAFFTPVIHRDIKLSNIFLDENYGARLSDFSVSVFLPMRKKAVPDVVLGTSGFGSPECMETGIVTKKSDVYSFGMLLLVLLTGRGPTDSISLGQDSLFLADFAREACVMRIIDPTVLFEWDSNDLVQKLQVVFELARSCIQRNAVERPTMSEVAKQLNLQIASLEDNHHKIVKEPFLSGEVMSLNLKVFTFDELMRATKNFRQDTVLCKGASGTVFKGWIDKSMYGSLKPCDNFPVAIKKFHSEGVFLPLNQWQSDLKFMLKLAHPNLVRLIGYCAENEDYLLVYEYMQNGSLNNNLFKSGKSLPWDIRVQIAIGAARGLTFLHGEQLQIIHRHFKSSHILLDGDYNSKLSDFGLAELGPEIDAPVVSTFGYADPCYVATGHLTIKSDVYSFGVVLLELVTGILAFDTSRPAGGHGLIQWAKPSLSSKRKLKGIMDPRLEDLYPLHGAFQVSQLILQCLESDPKKRPSMSDVLETLELVYASSIEDGRDDIVNEAFVSTMLRKQKLKLFSHSELKKATSNFRLDRLLGKGTYGKVYKGWVDEINYEPLKPGAGMPVAIKKLDLYKWQLALAVGRELSHPNLVKFLGLCWEGAYGYLVCEYMQRGCLENHLFIRHAQPLPWNIRLKIAEEAARGLAFLHMSEPQIIYLDFKLSKVLLDWDYNAKLAISELARLDTASNSYVTTKIVGTLGYIDPAYLATGHLHENSVTYSFGVVLLEMLLGLRAVDMKRPSDQHSLVEWAKPYLYDLRIDRIIDPRLQNQYPKYGAHRAAQLVLNCLESDPRHRPSMVEVQVTLARIHTIEER